MGIRRLQDRYTILAKQRGYPSRSVYKLEEILRVHKNYGIVSGDKILDLGAAPGSFSLYFVQEYSMCVFACDIKKLMVNHSKIVPIYGDFTDKNIADKIIKEGPFHLVISDAAPSTTGFKLTDHTYSLQLVEHAWNIAQQVLPKGGNFIAKLLGGAGGKDHQKFLKDLAVHFRKTKLFRPSTTRRESSEVYLLALDHKKK